MKYTLKAYNIMEFGARKDASGNPHQEDCMYPLPGELSDTDRTFVLCDGMGGHDAGEVASSTVCETMGRYIAEDGHDTEGVFTEKDLKGALEAAYDALDRKDNGAAKKMGTTMTFLKLHNQGATIAHIGDSRVYHIRPGKTGEDTRILFETSDHSLVNDLIKIGELTKEEARVSNQKNVITRAMQPGMSPRPKADVYTTSDIRPGDYFYMCSDGMLEQDDMEDGSTLRNIFSEQGGSDGNRVNILRSVTDDNRDNHTAIIVHILDVKGARPVATEMSGINRGVPTSPKVSREAIVSDEDVEERPKSVSGGATRKDKKGFPALVAFIGVAVIVVALIFCMRQCGNDNKSNEVKQKKVQSATQSQKTPAEKKPSKKTAPGGKTSGNTQEIENVAAPSVLTPPAVGSQTPPATSKPEINAEEVANKIKIKEKKPSSTSEEGVVESDQDKAKEAINNHVQPKP